MMPDEPTDSLDELPDELAELDAELRGLTLSERASFGPELEAELVRAWREGPQTRTAVGSGAARRALAASLAALLLTGLTVPPARASLIGGLELLLASLKGGEPAVADAVPTVPLPMTEGIEFGASGDADELRPEPAVPIAAVVGVDAGNEESAEVPAFTVSDATYPELVEPDAERRLIRRHYPPQLQEAGVGGTVRLLLWVDTLGAVDNVQIARGSGVQELDEAALMGAPSLRFRPATRGGGPVGTWVEFDLVFQPGDGPGRRPAAPDLSGLRIPDGLDFELPADGPGAIVVPAPIQVEARDLLLRAFREAPAVVESRLGPVEGLLAGEPPAGANPLAWRARALDALEEASARDPDNPAPYLALARLRRRQGARDEARTLFERGLERVRRSPVPVSPRMVAELHHEYSRALYEAWLAHADLGRLAPDALAAVPCGRTGDDVDDVEALVARNFVCPDAFDGVLARSFRPIWEGEGLHAAMVDHLEAALDAVPSHVGANVDLLLDLADDELWFDVLNGARSFAWATGGHPYALLLSGLALHRMGRSEEAAEDLGRALDRLGEVEAARLRSTAALRGSIDGGGPAADTAFFAALDPVLTTEVNEREVEHLARSAYAYLRFGSLEREDASVWVRYGRPLRVRTFATGAMRTEFWDYGRGPDLTFTRAAGGAGRVPTPETRTYLDELARAFPHWYGTRARRLYILPAQLARFRTGGVDEGRVDAMLEVPEAMMPEPGDTLVAGLFVLGADGTVIASQQRAVTGGTVRLEVETDGRAARVAAELFDPSGNQAASLRVPAVRGLGEGEDLRISDLLLTEPFPAPERTVDRDDPDLTPLVRADVLAGDRIGIYFEIYDLPLARLPYDLRVHLVDEASGRRVDVPFRPSGQTLFGSDWTRRSLHDDRPTPEYLVVDLGGVGAGTWTLQVEVELPDGNRFVSRRSGLSRSYRPVRLRADPVGM